MKQGSALQRTEIIMGEDLSPCPALIRNSVQGKHCHALDGHLLWLSQFSYSDKGGQQGTTIRFWDTDASKHTDRETNRHSKVCRCCRLVYDMYMLLQHSAA